MEDRGIFSIFSDGFVFFRGGHRVSVSVVKRKKSKAALNAEKKRSFSLSLSVNFFLIRRGLEVSPFNLNEGKR